MSGLSVRQVRNAWSSLVATKNFNHLQPFPRDWLGRTNFLDSPVKAAKPKDRIKLWNIVPGDKVRIRGHKYKGILEVAQVNKLSNRVMLKQLNEVEQDADDKSLEPSWINVHYSRLQLLVRMHQFPGRKEPSPVFATRLGKTGERWNTSLNHYTWHRYPLSTTPRLPPKLMSKMVPWPVAKKADKRDPNEIYDTLAEDVAEMTYELPGESELGKMSARMVEEFYVRGLYNPMGPLYRASSPIEAHVTRELSNPHSRAKRQARWKARQQYKKELLEKMTKAELADLKGRTRREARAEAAWRWKQQLDAEDRAERHRRWVARGGEAKLERKNARKARKAARQARVLQKLVLEDGPNQVVPNVRNP